MLVGSNLTFTLTLTILSLIAETFNQSTKIVSDTYFVLARFYCPEMCCSVIMLCCSECQTRQIVIILIPLIQKSSKFKILLFYDTWLALKGTENSTDLLP